MFAYIYLCFDIANMKGNCLFDGSHIQVGKV